MGSVISGGKLLIPPRIVPYLRLSLGLLRYANRSEKSRPKQVCELQTADRYLSPGGSRGLHRRVVLGQIPRHLVHEPLEALAVELVSQILLGRHVPRRQVAVLGPALVDVLGVLVHPHLGHALQVLKAERKHVQVIVRPGC